MLTKNSAIHIIDAANTILLGFEDMQCIHFLLMNASDDDVVTGYKRYICEIARQCESRERRH